MDGWETSFILGRPICRGYVSFREGIILFISFNFIFRKLFPFQFLGWSHAPNGLRCFMCRHFEQMVPYKSRLLDSGGFRWRWWPRHCTNSTWLGAGIGPASGPEWCSYIFHGSLQASQSGVLWASNLATHNTVEICGVPCLHRTKKQNHLRCVGIV